MGEVSVFGNIIGDKEDKGQCGRSVENLPFGYGNVGG